MDIDHPLRILILSDSCISNAHGTGASIIRNFDGYPRSNIMNLYTNRRGSPFFSSVRMTVDNEANVSLEDEGKMLSLFKPDMLYSVACGYRTLSGFATLLPQYFANTPYIQHFVDLIPGVPWPQYTPLLQRLSPHINAIWSLTQTGSDKLSYLLDRSVSVFPLFSNRINVDKPKQSSLPTDKLRVVMAGNSWNTLVFAQLVDAWLHAMKNNVPVTPIEWYCHPEGVERIRKAGIRFDSALNWQGCIEPHKLYGFIGNADAGLIPFNTGSDPFAEGSWEYDYVHCSLPSKIVDYCTAGLPIILAGTMDTETGRYIEDYNVGIVANPSDKSEFCKTLFDFARLPDKRLQLSRNARHLARTQYDNQKYLPRLLSKFKAITLSANT